MDIIYWGKVFLVYLLKLYGQLASSPGHSHVSNVAHREGLGTRLRYSVLYHREIKSLPLTFRNGQTDIQPKSDITNNSLGSFE
jgi:hypothetical protein